MLGIILMFVVAGAMKKIVETTGEPGMKWAVISMCISLVLMLFIGSFFAGPASLVITYLTYVVRSMKSA